MAGQRVFTGVSAMYLCSGRPSFIVGSMRGRSRPRGTAEVAGAQVNERGQSRIEGGCYRSSESEQW